MSEKNYEFIDIKRIEPETKSLNVRKVDFSEIYEQTNIKKFQNRQAGVLDVVIHIASGNVLYIITFLTG